MSQLDDLLARSRSPGAFVERKKFTLSREKAIEKQREFALRHPSQYVLELIQAAVFAGATYLAIDARPGSILVAWVGGRPFLQRELSDLLDYLFADRTDANTRHLVQLAVGVNAILQRKPQTLRIETGDGKSSVRVDLDHKGSGSVGEVEDPIAGTYLFAEFGGGWFQRFMGNTHTPEQTLIEERCLYTPVPILLNGRAPFGYRGTRHIEIFGARYQSHFDEDGRRGVVALHSDQRVTGYRMVTGGVWISTLPLPELATQPLVGVICDDGLRKTADHSDIVQDWRFAKMLHAVQPYASSVMQKTAKNYRPPRLPRVVEPKPEAPGETVREEVKLEPLPEPLPAKEPRKAVSLNQLKLLRKATPAESPIFWCPPEVSRELERYADPHRFAFPLFILTPGQAATLERELKDVQVHKIASRADVDFIRRVMERQARTRVHRFRDRGTDIELTLHLEGDPPGWGDIPAGVPFCSIAKDKTVAAGTVNGVRVQLSTQVEREPAPLSQPLELPGVSVRVLEPSAGRAIPDDVLVDKILAEAWHLALPDDGTADRPLLAALLGQVAIPRLINGDRAIGVSLPVGHPAGLRTATLALAMDGSPVSMGTLEDLIGTNEVVEVRDRAELNGLMRLEQRLGFGHLWHADLAGRPAWGVGYVGHRWVWLDSRDAWRKGMTQVIFVGSTFRPRLGDQDWHTVSHPHPVLVHAVRHSAEPEHAEAGWELLYRELARMEFTDTWTSNPHPHGLSGRRARGMGRLALLHLANMLEHVDQPLLMPTDGGARRSLRDVRTEAGARLVARQGVQVSEPWTFALTADERAAIDQPDNPLVLRYDDPPEVWASLTDDEKPGWLLHEQVREGGLSGWLGLRHPYDHTTGLLVRATGRLVGIPELDRKIPCHGLLWPDGEARVPTPEQEQLLQLAGLRLYQKLVELLSTERDRERIETARRYAMHFVLRSHAGGKLSATARELARRAEVRDADGSVWGTLEAWLGAPVDQRPGLPEGMDELARLQTQTTELVAPRHGDEDASFEERLTTAVANPEVRIFVERVNRGNAGPVVPIASRCSRDSVALGLNEDHRLVQALLDGSARAREVLLLECARKICSSLTAHQRPTKLPPLQQKLVAQRLGTA